MSDLFDNTKTRTMKAISLWQPWATLIARGLKVHETRHWPTAYRGAVAIHAAKTLDLAGAPEPLCRAGLGRLWWAECPSGAVVAVARLSGCELADLTDTTRADLAAGNFTPGRYAWRLSKIRPLGEPIPLTGRQGLFNWTPPDDLADRLGAVLNHDLISASIGWA